MTGYSWDDIRDMLIANIEVYYVRNHDVNVKREQDKDETINWILERLKEGPRPEGSKAQLPACTYTFGDLWEPISKAVRMKYPHCQICGNKPTYEIHHIRPRYLRGTHDPCNLIAVCVECHDEIHRRIEQGITKAVIDSMDFKPEGE